MPSALAGWTFVVVFGISLVGSAPLPALQPESTSPLVVRGRGPDVVLINGLLGGTARLSPLADQLVQQGFRVVLVDPYRLAANAENVSFHGMAQVVAQSLRQVGVESAIVIAHAHGSGVALRLAAHGRELVAEVLLLDAGVLARTRSSGVTRSLQVASLIARLPGGSSLIRARLTAGIQANSGDDLWLNADVARAYSEPFIAELPAVHRMATRLAEATEPESVERLLPQVRVPVTVLLGAAPHGFSATRDELALLQRLPEQRIRWLANVGHFIHEEAPHEVVSEVVFLNARRTLALR
jgi:pimeloyl-ACP methyl ester carboxylesterase